MHLIPIDTNTVDCCSNYKADLAVGPLLPVDN